jgi:antitoxin VapB
VTSALWAKGLQFRTAPSSGDNSQIDVPAGSSKMGAIKPCEFRARCAPIIREEGQQLIIASRASAILGGRGLTYAMAYAKLNTMERYVKLFKNGRNQAVRIPRDFELPGEDAIIRKEGQRLIIEPAPPQSLLAVLAALPTLDDEFPSIEDLPAEPVDL